MEEIGGGTQSWENHGKPLEESQVVFLFGFSPGEKLFWRYWRCLAPLKNKKGQLLQSQNKSRNWQKK